MLDHILQVASNLDCNMESLISDLQHQYSVVSQAMLLQAMSGDNNHQHQQQQQHPRQMHTTSKPTSKTIRSQEHHPAAMRSIHRDIQQGELRRKPAAIKQTFIQCAPLDLSVKQTCQTNNQPARSRPMNHTNHRRQSLSLDLVKIETRVNQDKYGRHNEPNLDSNNNEQRAAQQQQQIKLISSSTSPTTDDDFAKRLSASSSASSSSRTSSSCLSPEIDAGLGRATDTCYPSAASIDVISSTNGHRLKRKTSKKQKGTKSHLCNHCGRSFSRSDMLTRHSRLHSGLKPYQCGKCFQVFSRSDHLSTHERTHTGEKPYQCGICAYSACRRDMITRHMRTHLGQRVEPKSKTTPATTTSDTNDHLSKRRIKRDQRFVGDNGIPLKCDDDRDSDEKW